jgi:aminoglycoside phosphotransferase (APT) family kinase protein
LRVGLESVVHGDVGPWNILWQGESALALIDFDEARPGERVYDLGYLAWKGLRLNAAGPSAREQWRRLAVLADAYGMSLDATLMTAIRPRVPVDDRQRHDRTLAGGRNRRHPC